MTDSHVHVTMMKAPDQFLQRSLDIGVNRLVLAGFNAKDFDKQQTYKAKYPKHVLTSVGLHPWHIIQQDHAHLEKEWKQIETAAKHADFIGETGLDRVHCQDPHQHERMRDFFERHIALSTQLDKPLILHLVKADAMGLECLGKLANLRGIFHSFNGSIETAHAYYKMGFLISIGPGILKQGFLKLKAAAPMLASNQFLFESDSPQSFEDDDSDPTLIQQVISEFSKLQGKDFHWCIDHAEKNLDLLLGKV